MPPRCAALVAPSKVTTAHDPPPRVADQGRRGRRRHRVGLELARHPERRPFEADLAVLAAIDVEGAGEAARRRRALGPRRADPVLAEHRARRRLDHRGVHVPPDAAVPLHEPPARDHDHPRGDRGEHEPTTREQPASPGHAALVG